MREIKFRGQRIDNKEWIIGDLIKNYPEIGKPIKVYPGTISQFTGFKDKNDKEIYEGDILSDFVETDEGIKQSFMQVFWCNKTGAWKLDDSFNQDKSSGEMLSDELLKFQYQITGNIYEPTTNKQTHTSTNQPK